MRNSLIFGGINSADYDVWISGTNTFSAPERDVEYVSVPGRNGDLIIDNGRWNNIKITYPAFIMHGFESKIDEFRAALLKKKGYQRLEDTYHPDEFRLASFSYGLNPENIAPFLKSGEFDLVFNCKPQRFLKSGEEPVQLFPVAVSGLTVYSHYMPIAGPLHFDVHCLSADRLSVTVNTYDANGTQLTSNTHTCADGDSKDISFAGTDKYWRISITGYNSLSDISLHIQTVTEYNGASLPIDAVMCRRLILQNPTGYATKPLIEVYGDSFPYTDIFNKIGGVTDETFGFRSNVVTGADHMFLDCDMQYMYDDEERNVTNKLIIDSSHDSHGKSLVFSEFGTEEIILQMYYPSALFGTGLGLVQIYPRWWKL